MMSLATFSLVISTMAGSEYSGPQRNASSEVDAASVKKVAPARDLAVPAPLAGSRANGAAHDLVDDAVVARDAAIVAEEVSALDPGDDGLLIVAPKAAAPSADGESVIDVQTGWSFGARDGERVSTTNALRFRRLSARGSGRSPGSNATVVAAGASPATSTATATSGGVGTAGDPATLTATSTAVIEPTDTPSANTATAVASTATNTVVPAGATNTTVPATATNTAVPATATNTAVPPTATNTAVPATNTPTPLPATATNTVVVAATWTPTIVPGTLTPTPVNTPVPSTATPTEDAVAAAATATAKASIPGNETMVPLGTSTPTRTPTPTRTATPIPATATKTPTPVPATATKTPTPVPPTPTKTPTKTATPVVVPTPTTPPQSGTRDKFKQPFASTSIWNMPIGSNANYAAAGIKDWTAWGVFEEENYIFNNPSAPMTPLRWSGDLWSGGSRCNPDNANSSPVATVPLPANFILPGASGGNTPNNAAAMITQDGNNYVQTQPLTHCTTGSLWTTGYVQPTVSIYGDGITGCPGWVAHVQHRRDDPPG